MAGPFVELRGIRKCFGNVEALRGIDLQIMDDELLVVLGPTGAGKTTLLRTIVGLETPDAGSVRIDGEDCTHAPPAARNMAMVFQQFSLYPDWTVRRNMEFPLRAPGRSETRDQINERVGWAASLLKIGHLLDRRSNRLSGGEMQRVAIGRAIVRRPRLFLMDEPLSNLDAKLREALRVEMACLRRELKTPMVFVTHDQAEALSMADRIVVLTGGAVLQTGPPEEIYRRPVSPAVARQLGQPKINVISVSRSGGEWLAEDGTPILEATDGETDPSCGAGFQPAHPMLIGIRPEDIQPRGGRHPATIEVIEDMGPTVILLIRWLGARLHVVTPKPFAAHPGDQVYPLINPSRVVFWEPTER